MNDADILLVLKEVRALMIKWNISFGCNLELKDGKNKTFSMYRGKKTISGEIHLINKDGSNIDVCDIDRSIAELKRKIRMDNNMKIEKIVYFYLTKPQMNRLVSSDVDILEEIGDERKVEATFDNLKVLTKIKTLRLKEKDFIKDNDIDTIHFYT